MKILLVSPGTSDEIDNLIIRGIPYLFAKAFTAPHAVATIAALTPAEHDVTIFDEYMKGPVDHFLPGTNWDIIGISVTSNQLNRSLQIAKLCKENCPNATIVAGGIGVETLIIHNKADFDVVFNGEAEETWPLFLKDFQQGSYLSAYKTVSKPDMTKTPPPRWDLIKDDIRSYNSVSVQTTRGCPFDCSFCDVIYVYGRKPRSKTIDQVLEEIKRLSDLNIQMVFIADDNFAGDKKYVKELLRRLIPINNSFREPLGFFTQLDLTVAQDDELLRLLADANFYTLMIGVESISEESLKDLNKKQNIGFSIVDAINKIQSYGITVLVHMIIGADSDNKSVFEKTAAFVKEANIIFHICHPLAAPPGTRIWYDLKRQKRIVHIKKDETLDQLDILSNIIPKQMTRIELFEGLADYWEKIYDPDAFLQRALGFMKGIKNKPNSHVPAFKSAWMKRKMIARVFRFYIFEAGKKHRNNFFKLLRAGMHDMTYLMPKIIYMYSFYLIDLRRSQYDARIAREHAQWEREHPENIIPDTGIIPVSEHIRLHARQIVGTAYQIVRKKTGKKELLYHTVLQAMTDFNDRFGNTFREPDDFHLEQIKVSCERVLEKIETSKTDESMLSDSEPPVGFTREIIDALDNCVRYNEVSA
jgi:radical SAM superfamily enzyme YgiQ (UPF0313 family)